MPVSQVFLDSTGSAIWIAPKKLTSLTIINQTTASVKFALNDAEVPVTLNNSQEVEFEEDEAKPVERIGFTAGLANGTILVSWA